MRAAACRWTSRFTCLATTLSHLCVPECVPRASQGPVHRPCTFMCQAGTGASAYNTHVHILCTVVVCKYTYFNSHIDSKTVGRVTVTHKTSVTKNKIFKSKQLQTNKIKTKNQIQTHCHTNMMPLKNKPT